jgi:uncharacterized surface protein with fasciclin (FAS1) repeats
MFCPSNGIIQAIDTIIVPPGLTARIAALAARVEGTTEEQTEREAEEEERAEEEPAATIYDYVSSRDDMKQLATLLDLSGLADLVKGEAKVTLYAPTDAAFEAIPKDTARRLATAAGRDELRAILEQHIHRGVSAKPTVAFAGHIIEDAVELGNGRVYVVDVVLLPPKPKSPPKASAKPIAKANAKPAPKPKTTRSGGEPTNPAVVGLLNQILGPAPAK